MTLMRCFRKIIMVQGGPTSQLAELKVFTDNTFVSDITACLERSCEVQSLRVQACLAAMMVIDKRQVAIK